MPKRAKKHTPPAEPSAPIADIERELLRALCLGSSTRAERKRNIAQLAGHIWEDSEHRVVYEAICQLGNRNAAALRAELPAEATRMGFPDIDWKTYFDSLPTTSTTVTHPFRQLKKRGKA